MAETAEFVGAWNVVCNGWVPRDGWHVSVWRRVFEALASSDGISKVDVTAEAFYRIYCREARPSSYSPFYGYEMLLRSLERLDARAKRGEEGFEVAVVRFAQAVVDSRRLERRGPRRRDSSLRGAKGALLVLSEVLAARRGGLEELRLREFWDAEDFGLAGSGSGGFVTQLSEIVEKNRSLERLELACTFNPSTLARFAAAIRTHPRLEEVEIGARAENDDVVDDAGVLAALIGTNRVIRKLTLYDDPLSHAGFAAMCAALETNEALRSLTLGFAGGEGASAALARLCATLTAGRSRLATLHIADCGLPASRLVDYFADALPSLTSLRELKVGFFCVGPTVARLARSVSRNTSLRKLVIWTVPRDLDTDVHSPDLSIDDEVVFALSDALASNSTLRDLSLDNCDVSDAAAASLADVLASERNTTLRALDLDSNRLEGDSAVAKFAQVLSQNRSLTSLSLRRGPLVGDSGAVKLASAIVSSRLTALDLSSCSLSDATAFAVAALLRAPNCPLTTLTLTHNRIGDLGARELAHALCAASNTTLARLDLSFNDIDPNVTAFNSAEAFADHFNRKLQPVPRHQSILAPNFFFRRFGTAQPSPSSLSSSPPWGWWPRSATPQPTAASSFRSCVLM
ncbi:hypothetical protein CTAYLR_007270 [Chrysophaeum taylorii]|uniref:Uncharacterized protein n=1 Tax=Chrysophaeum taylorii TaxID=2483200 RepID=A0AAD7UKL1_9STRA|nr:hypothetical protein CTAYLR_007270 [Chrysophaeum taylorii]